MADNENNVLPQNTDTINHASAMKQKKVEFENIVSSYLNNNPIIPQDRKVSELEIRFGTNPRLSKPISKMDYDNVVKQLYACGFKPENKAGNQILRIQNEYIDTKTGKLKMSNIRAEIVGTDLIQEYCRTNNIQKVIDMPSTLFNKIKFTQKMSAKNEKDEYIRKLDMEDFNFRVSYQTEQDFNIQSNLARNIISKWVDSKKLFRTMNRVRFYHDDYPLFADLSIVKSSKRMNKIPIPYYTIQESELFTNQETYEIELEIDNSRVGTGTEYTSAKALLIEIRKCIRIILSGLQSSKYPISFTERDAILQEYMRIIRGSDYVMKRVYPKDFIGPGSYTLQIENIINPLEDSNIINIRKNYTVTDKADGDRKLLFINKTGKIYLIDTNMNILFTGSKTNEKTIFNSILDGEHISEDKYGKYLNLYAAFDVYFVNKKSVREYPFVKYLTQEEEEKLLEENDKSNAPPSNYRLNILNELIELIKPKSILEVSNSEMESNDKKKSSDFIIKCKNFNTTLEYGNIFSACSKKLSEINDGLFEYNTDGLIFTPMDLAVGSNKVGEMPSSLYKTTWNNSFKWKPAEFNTIDFLVSIKKDKSGRDEVHNKIDTGENTQGSGNVIQYKTLILRCGFDEKKHGYLNPCQDILNDNIPNPDDIDNNDTYKPVPFQPTSPYDENAHICNIVLKGDENNMYMMTEENEYFEDDMIVEFRYDINNTDGWRWIPLRVRYDKTSELRAGLKNYGNAYHVANNNWHSIHQPITELMISTGENLPEYEKSNDIYYNPTSDETSTRSLRDFHNLYVKNRLIIGISNRDDTLIDYAVGKAGDLPKWIRSKLRFVFGIDISKDNINNQMDGACARYLNSAKKYNKLPKVLFVTGNSSLNIRNGDAVDTDKDKQIIKAVFGNGPKDIALLGKGVYNQYGIGENGFNISSCQFAMHYFFENKTTFHNFLRNIAECTKINGYFTGTCYDGNTVFNLLKSKNKGESISIIKNNRKIYEITKEYDQTGFPSEEMSLGYAINVYQESINQVFREYLVNFEYFTRIMEDYGFILVTKEEAINMDLPDGTGLFVELYNSMEHELKMNPANKNYGKSIYMSPEERKISFMNRYFVFKKIRSVDVKKMEEIIVNNEKETADVIETIIDNKPNKSSKKTNKKKIILQKIEVVEQ
tara:strand:+ start:8797 stop:12279 length:3483 start_codon:yes stop_codon:yes gene_type:complete